MRGIAAGAGSIVLAACATVPVPSDPAAADVAAIEAAMAAHIAILASDDFGGRRPATQGEGKTLDYLTRAWQDAGLEPGTNKPSSPWLAPIDLVRSTPSQSMVEFWRNGRVVTLPNGSVTVFASGQRALLELAPMVFVGKQWRDLDRSELTGRVAVMLWDHADQAEQRDALLEKGASAVLAVVQSGAELAQLSDRRAAGSYRLADDSGGAGLDGYMGPGAANILFGANQFKMWKHAAGVPGFRPVPLRVAVSMEATSATAAVQTHNLIGKIAGATPDAGSVLLMAHWDHFGTCSGADRAVSQSDMLCNGAVDNASGLAMLTELARRLAAGPQMDRDVYFVATSAEEWGLLGARALVADPPMPLDTIVAGFNVDTIAIAPRGSGVAIVGAGLTPLDDTVKSIIRAQGRSLGDNAFAAGFVRRQDGWALLQHDVPMLMVSSAFANWDIMERYLKERYHQPTDQAERVELGGAAEDLLLHLALVRYFADAAVYQPAISQPDGQADDLPGG